MACSGTALPFYLMRVELATGYYQENGANANRRETDGFIGDAVYLRRPLAHKIF
jgi:hypothetical protein